MKSSTPQTAGQLESFVGQLNKIILDKVMGLGRQYYKEVMEAIDEMIVENRPRELTIEHKREVWYQTCLGAVKI